MMKPSNRKRLGAALCIAAALVLTAGWAWSRSSSTVSTDNAYVRANITSMAPKVGGYITSIAVGDNQRVEAGDILFRIDDRDYRAKLKQADASVDAARARLAGVLQEMALQRALVRQAVAQHSAALVEVALAGTTSRRRRALAQGGSVSQAQVDESDAGMARTQAGASAAMATVDAQRQKIGLLATQRNAAAAALAQAAAARDLARIDLENTVVRAPISGVVGNRQLRLGRLVVPGTQLLDIVPVGDLFVVANFKETQLEDIWPGQAARIEIDGYPGTEFEGVVDSFAPGSGSAFSLIPSDNATGNFVRVVQRVSVKIRFRGNPLPGRRVTGLSARVSIAPGEAS